MIETELRREHDDAFVIRTDEPDFQAVLPSLAYAPEADDEFARRFLRNEVTPAIYERFRASVPALLAHTARHEAPPWEKSLENLHQLLAGANIAWMLGGSAALAIRGVQLTPRDIDFTVADQHATAGTLDHLLIEPPIKANGGWVAEWFGRAGTVRGSNGRPKYAPTSTITTGRATSAQRPSGGRNGWNGTAWISVCRRSTSSLPFPANAVSTTGLLRSS